MCPVMEGIHGAGTDCISGSHPNLTGLELLTSGESHIQNGGSPFVRQDGVPTSDENPPQHAVSNSQDTCWAPPAWDHSCHSPEGGDADDETNRLQWHLKSPAWDFSMSGHAGPGSDIMRRTHGSDWGTQDEGFILGGTITGSAQKGLFSMCSASSNGATSHFGASLGFPSAAVTGGNGLLGSSCSPSENEVKPCKGWREQGSELNVLNLGNTDSKVQIERGDLESIHSRMDPGGNQQSRHIREQHSRMYLGNVQRDGSISIHVKEEVKLGDAKDAQNCTLPRNGVTVGDPSIGLRLGRRMYFEDAVEGGTTRGQAPSIPLVTGSSAVKKQRTLAPGAHVPRCQVEGCKADLSAAKDYHRRHKVCEMHSKAPKVIADGMEQRFCQQCSRFHGLGEFDESKRSCRRRLAGHNQRRRKSSHDTSAPVAASIGQDHRSALSILDRSYFMQHHPLPISSVLDEHDSRRGWPMYDKLDDQVTLACRMQVLNGGSSIPRHSADRLLMMLQGSKGLMMPHSNKSSSSPEIHHHPLYVQAPISVGQGLTLSPSTGPGVLASSLSSPGLSADSGRALSLLSSQSLSSKSNAEKFMDENHHHSLSQGFANSHTCGATAQSGFVSSGQEKLFGLSSTVNHKEQDPAGSLMSGLGDPVLAQLLHGQDFRRLNTQHVRPTLDLMQLPSSHSHQMGLQDGNGGGFAELPSLRPYEASIFGHQQQLI